MENDSNYYSTTDLYAAAWLAASGHKLLEIRPKGGRKVMVFELSLDDGQDEIAAYYNGDEISGLDYSNSVKNLKNMIANTR